MFVSSTSSGKLSQMNTVSTQLVPTMATLTCSLRESMSTTMRPQEASTYQEQSLLTWNQVQWIQSGQDLLDKFSDQTTLYLVSCFYCRIKFSINLIRLVNHYVEFPATPTSC